MQRQDLMKQPDIIEYPFRSTFRTYLHDWFAWRKATYGARSRKGRVYSHRLFSRRVGFRSTGLLCNVIKGRQDLSPTMVEQFLGELALSEPGASVFRALVAHDQALEDVTRKEEALANLLLEGLAMSLRGQEQLERDAARRCYAEARDRLWTLMTFTLCQGLNEREIEWLGSWFYAAIHEITTGRGVQQDPDWTAATLRPRSIGFTSLRPW